MTRLSAGDREFFDGLREKAIVRDGGRCVSCGMTREAHREQFGEDITVDHIDGKGCRTPKAMRNNTLDNLQTLCAPCHGRKDGKRGLGVYRDIDSKYYHEGKTISEWANELGIAKATIYNRLNMGWSLGKALAEHRLHDTVVKRYRGKTREEWATLFGVSLAAYRSYCKRHGDDQATNYYGRSAE